MDGLQADTDCTAVLLCSDLYDQRTSANSATCRGPGPARVLSGGDLLAGGGEGRGSIGGGTGGVIRQEDRDYSRCA